MKNKLTLQGIEWKEYFIGGQEGIFDIQSTNSGIDKNKLNMEVGNVPYITRSDINNGINLFVNEKQNSKYKLDEGNVITIGLDTQTVFYQKNDFYTGQNIQILRNANINKEIALFIIPLLKIQMQKFNWGGNGATLSRLNRTKIMLPTDENGNPNWKFMEDYIKQEQKEIASKVVKYYQNKLAEILESIDGGALQPIKYKNVNWKIFSIDELFDVKIGKSIDGNKIQNNIGETPYITRKTSDNGVEAFIDGYDEKYLCTDFPVITIGNETAKPFVQSTSFYTGTKVNILKPKYEMDLDCLHFISVALENVCDRYSYSFTINSSRLKKQKIILPVDENGNLDFKYMQNFVINMQKEKIEKTLEYIYIYIISTIIERYKNEYSINNIEWKEFFIEDIFEIKSGKDIYKSERIDGKIPYITATANNNGVGYYVDVTGHYE